MFGFSGGIAKKILAKKKPEMSAQVEPDVQVGPSMRPPAMVPPMDPNTPETREAPMVPAAPAPAPSQFQQMMQNAQEAEAQRPKPLMPPQQKSNMQNRIKQVTGARRRSGIFRALSDERHKNIVDDKE